MVSKLQSKLLSLTLFHCLYVLGTDVPDWTKLLTDKESPDVEDERAFVVTRAQAVREKEQEREKSKQEKACEFSLKKFWSGRMRWMRICLVKDEERKNRKRGIGGSSYLWLKRRRKRIWRSARCRHIGVRSEVGW